MASRSSIIGRHRTKHAPAWCAGVDRAGKTGPLTVRDAIEHYLQFLDANRKSGRDTRYNAVALVLPQLGDIEVASLTRDQLERLRDGIVQSPARLRTKPGDRQRHRALARGDDDGRRRRQSTANPTLTILKAALNRVWQQGKVPSDAAWRRVKPFENVDTARVRYLTIAEATRLINAADPEIRPLVKAALQTGARYGELTRLEVPDFNPHVGTVTIRQSKRGKPRHVVLTEEGPHYSRAGGWPAATIYYSARLPAPPGRSPIKRGR